MLNYQNKMIKAKVIDPNYPQYKDIIFDVTGTTNYQNRLGENMTWYHLDSDHPPIAANFTKLGRIISYYSTTHLYFGEKQIELIDSEPYLK